MAIQPAASQRKNLAMDENVIQQLLKSMRPAFKVAAQWPEITALITQARTYMSAIPESVNVQALGLSVLVTLTLRMVELDASLFSPEVDVHDGFRMLLDMVVITMRAHPSSERVQEIGAGVLANLCATSARKHHVLAVADWAAHTNQGLESSKTVVLMLRNLSVNVGANSKVLAGLAPRARDIALAYSAASLVQYGVLDFFDNLIHFGPDNNDTSAWPWLLDFVVTTMRTHGACPCVQRAGLGVLWQLSLNRSPEVLLPQLSAIEVAHAALTMYENHEDIQAAALAFFHNLALDLPQSRVPLLTTVPAVVRYSLGNHGRRGVLEDCIWMLMVLAKEESNRMTLRELVVHAVEAGMRAQASDYRVQGAGYGLFTVLGHGGPNYPEYQASNAFGEHWNKMGRDHCILFAVLEGMQRLVRWSPLRSAFLRFVLERPSVRVFKKTRKVKRR